MVPRAIPTRTFGDSEIQQLDRTSNFRLRSTLHPIKPYHTGVGQQFCQQVTGLGKGSAT